MDKPTAEDLGRFNHHPDPAIDFCVEVESLQGLVYDAQLGMANRTDVAARLANAMCFVPGGDAQAVKAKETLRALHHQFFFTDPMDGNPDEVAASMAACGRAWQPGARLIGNCRARDIIEVANGYLSLKAEVVRYREHVRQAIIEATNEDAAASPGDPLDVLLFAVIHLRRKSQRLTEENAKLKAEVQQLTEENEALHTENNEISNERNELLEEIEGGARMDKPTAEDLARDLEADLAVCEKAPPPPWVKTQIGHFEGNPDWCEYEVVSPEGPVCGNQSCYPPPASHVEMDMIAAARSGWPAAIRRARAAEAEVERLRKELYAIADQPLNDDQMRMRAVRALGHLGGDYPPATFGEIERLEAENERIRAEVGRLNEKPRETQASMSVWAEQTFGPASSNLRVAARANEEMAELLKALATDDSHPKAGEEVADIVIILQRLATRLGVTISEAVDSKMALNRSRAWNLDGTGHGYHVKP